MKGLLYGGFASMLADVITLPIDTTKTRLQLSGSGSIKCVACSFVLPLASR